MRRCLELAKLAAGNTAPNPMVGAVLVSGDRVIGEGYHRQWGKAHAEPNCIASVKEEDRKYIAQSTLYVSLEPCAHFGKTPPCADLIIRNNIPHVVVACRDPFDAVNGKGIEKLLKAGIKVDTGVLEREAVELNKRFFTFHQRKRPYVILKWAQTSDKKIASNDEERLLISNHFSNTLVHQWRSEEAAILIGTNTARLDDPELTNRLWTGPSPIRLVVDLNLRLPETLKIFKKGRTIIFNYHKGEEVDNVMYFKLSDKEPLINSLMSALYELNIQSVLVEGGAKLLQSFLDANCWDERRVITNTALEIKKGLDAPVVQKSDAIYQKQFGNDLIEIFVNKPGTITL